MRSGASRWPAIPRPGSRASRRSQRRAEPSYGSTPRVEVLTASFITCGYWAKRLCRGLCRMASVFGPGPLQSLSIFGLAAAQYARLLRSQYWDPERQSAHARGLIRETMASASRIPFYAQRSGDDLQSCELQAVPILGRAEIPLLNRSVRSLYTSTTRFSSDSSSGSTGRPVEFLFDSTHQAGRFAARARYLRANGWTPLKKSV